MLNPKVLEYFVTLKQVSFWLIDLFITQIIALKVHYKFEHIRWLASNAFVNSRLLLNDYELT